MSYRQTEISDSLNSIDSSAHSSELMPLEAGICCSTLISPDVSRRVNISYLALKVIVLSIIVYDDLNNF